MRDVLRIIFERLASRWGRFTGSIRAQLIFWNVVVLSLLLIGFGVVCRFVTLTYMLQSVNRDLEHSIAMFQRSPHRRPPGFGGDNPFRPNPNSADGHGDHHGDGPSQPPDSRPNKAGPAPPHQPGPSDQFHARLFYAVGQPEMSSDKQPLLDESAFARALKGEKVFSTVYVDGDPVQVLSAPGFDRQDRKAAVQSAYSLKEVYRALAGIDLALLLLIPVGLIGAGCVGVLLTNRVLSRVHRMTQAAGQIGAADFTRRLPVSGSDEFSELAQTFNGMLGRLDEAYEDQKQILHRQRRFTGDASHELKTPLTIIKGRASFALSRPSTDPKSCLAFREINEAADAMSNLVQDLLLLAKSDGGQMGRDSVELLAREVLEGAKGQAKNESAVPILISVEPEDLCITGNQGELTRLFRNLLDNAAQFTPSKGKIEVSAAISNNQIRISVKDSGLGITPEHLPHLGERFYRVDSSRARPDGGTGLGLSICKSIVDAHRGSISIESELGKGTTVQVLLPQ